MQFFSSVGFVAGKEQLLSNDATFLMPLQLLVIVFDFASRFPFFWIHNMRVLVGLCNFRYRITDLYVLFFFTPINIEFLSKDNVLKIYFNSI